MNCFVRDLFVMDVCGLLKDVNPVQTKNGNKPLYIKYDDHIGESCLKRGKNV